MQVRSHSSSQCLYGFRLIIDFNIVLLKSLGTEKCLNEIKPVKLKAFIRLLKRKIDVAEPFNAGNRIRNRTIPQEIIIIQALIDHDAFQVLVVLPQRRKEYPILSVRRIQRKAAAANDDLPV